MFEEDRSRLQAAVEYLERHSPMSTQPLDDNVSFLIAGPRCRARSQRSFSNRSRRRP
jgi:hypothetical protein